MVSSPIDPPHRLNPHGVLPILEGTVILLQVDWLPCDATAKPVSLWWSQPTATTAEAFLRRFDSQRRYLETAPAKAQARRRFRHDS